MSETGNASTRQTANKGKRHPDAKLLKLCAELEVADAEVQAVFQLRTSIEAEIRTDPELTVLWDRRHKLHRRVAQCRPKTEEGWIAFARAAQVGAYRLGTEVLARDDNAHLMAWVVVSRMAGLPELTGGCYA